MAEEMFRMEGITKIYSNGFIANKDISFAVNESEIHALVGENGAGKTTLMRVLFGMEDRQGGSIYIRGEEVNIQNPLDAIAKGIGMVHQHFMLLPSLSVAENVVLGIEPLKNGLFDFEKAVGITQEVADTYKFNVDARMKVKDLSVGLMQKVEIIKALIKGAKVLILDEPTAVLTPQETEELFEQLILLRNNGHAIIFISHKLEEIMHLCSRVTILRHGYCQGTFNIEDLDEKKISQLMVGRDVILEIEKTDPKRGKAVVEIRDLLQVDPLGNPIIKDFSLNLYEGEITGIAGVEGNGQKEISEMLSGMARYTGGSIAINGTEITGKSIYGIRTLGLAHIPEDRMLYGCVANLSIKENIIADRYRDTEFKRGLFMNRKKINQVADKYIKLFEIACDNRDQQVRMLSGGNMQKVVVAREFTSKSNVLLANQPTRGIDVGTSEMIRKTMVRKCREDNMAVLLISADLNEILEVSDRLLVMRGGRIVAVFPKAKRISEETLGEYMLGIKEMTAEEIRGLL
ncbi:MAG: ABC transporter ATP-binding protein [Treponema sp.]|jgi:simple sugar transport system ATP-binding protein|nr:ABC transporter ATP-binding protein [Treponema sp.]